MEENEEKVERKEKPKRVAKPTMSPEAIESRYQAHLEKLKRGGK